MSRIFKNTSSDEENDDYAYIAPNLPPRQSFSGKIDLSTNMIQNRHALSQSQVSLHYKPPPLGDTNTVYSEIDGWGKRRLERRPSDYEPVLVKNIGLVSTEALDILNPEHFFPGKDKEKEEEKSKGHILNDCQVPSMDPGLSNRYETIGNPGFQARSGISPAHNVDEEMKTFEEGKVITSQTLANLSARAASISMSSNPMYSTSTSTLNGKHLKKYASLSHNTKAGQLDHTEDGYCIPSKIKRPDLSSKLPKVDAIAKTSSSERVPDGTHGDEEQKSYVNNSFEHSTKVLYAIPNSPKESSSNVVNRVTSAIYATISDRPERVNADPNNADPNYHGYNVPQPTNSVNDIPQTDQIGTSIVSYDIPRCSSKGVAGYDVLTPLDKVTNLSKQN